MKFETVFCVRNIFIAGARIWVDVHRCTPVYTDVHRCTPAQIPVFRFWHGSAWAAAAPRLSESRTLMPLRIQPPVPSARNSWWTLEGDFDFAIPAYSGVHRCTSAYPGGPRMPGPNPVAIGGNPAGGSHGTGWDYGERSNPEFPRVGGINICSRQCFSGSCKTVAQRCTSVYTGVHQCTPVYIHSGFWGNRIPGSHPGVRARGETQKNIARQ